jgi:hypothetical protein
MNCGLLEKANGRSMSWIPRLEEGFNSQSSIGEKAVSTSEVGSTWFGAGCLEKVHSTSRQETHQAITLFVVNARFVGRIANPLQECCLASIGAADHENTKMTVFLSSVKGG